MNISIPPDSLRPLIMQCLGEALAELERVKASSPSGPRLCYSEAEAAQMLGLARHQLRDLRRRQEISASRLVGQRVAYLHEDLIGFLKSRRFEPAAAR